jgi:dipeptidyl aminopeptidase/acylaminoacyl peptidase
LKKAILAGVTWLALAGSASADPELLPISHFASLPKIGGPSSTSNVALSPDGSRYAAIVAVKGVAALASVPTDGSEDIQIALYGDYRPEWFDWATDRHVLASFAFPSRRYGIETVETRLAVMDTETGKLENLIRHPHSTPRDREPHYSQFQDEVVSRLPVNGDEVRVALDRDEPGLPGVFRFPVKGGGSGDRLLRHRAGIQAWYEDAAGEIRLGYGLHRRSTGALKYEARMIFRKTGDEDFTIAASFDSRDLDGEAFRVVGFTEEPNVILIKDLNEHGRLAVYRFDVVKSKVVETVFSHEKYDAGAVEYAAGTDRVVAVHYVADKAEAVYFDPVEKDDYEALGRIFKGLQSSVVSRDRSGTKAIIRTESPSSPPAYHYFDVRNNVYARLGSAYPALDGMVLSETTPVAYDARDGLKIDGYLSTPAGAEARNLQLIVFPHGGPASRDSLGYDYWVQYFASRGWAVLQMNFRGSSGYGAAFRNAGDREWGKAMQDDITDGVLWAVEQGIADASRVCIVGASYGGYAALQGLVSTPELYKCAVALNGVSDIQSMISDDRYYSNYIFSRDYFSQDDNREVSPIHHVEKVQAPVLLAYGEDDRVVRPDQSTGMVAALRRADKPVTALELKKGDHYLSREDNRIAFFEAMDAFLREHLGLGPVPSGQGASAEAQ